MRQQVCFLLLLSLSLFQLLSYKFLFLIPSQRQYHAHSRMCFERAPCSVVGGDAHGSCQSEASCSLLKPAVTFKSLSWEILTVLNAELWGLWDC